MSPLSNGRLAVSLLGIAALALLAWGTMEPGRTRQLTWLLLGFFAFRIVLTRLRSRRMNEEPVAESSAGADD